MKYLSICSGIEAATVAWESLGWKPVAFAENDDFPSQILAKHYPRIPNWGDITAYKEWPDAKINLLIGGTPCQSFSISGKREGIDDPRGRLMFSYVEIVKRYKPKWIVWENVPGVLSSGKGRDFGALLWALAQCGYGLAWRVLDAQYYGVPQRRRRVFVVGYLGDAERARAVLFEPEGLCRDPSPGRQARKETAARTPRRPRGNRQLVEQNVINTLTAKMQGSSGWVPYNETAHIIPFDLKALNWPAKVAPTLYAMFGVKWGYENQHIDNGGGLFVPGGRTGVRRLTVVECERLQGFPDDWTQLDEKTRISLRYRAIGNSMAVPVVSWIGQRIKIVSGMKKVVDSGQGAT